MIEKLKNLYFCDPDPDPTGGSNHQKVNEQCLTQCPSDPDPDPMGELALISNNSALLTY